MADFDADRLRHELDADWQAEAIDLEALAIPDSTRRRFWAWYDAHADDVILRKGFWVFSITVRVRNLHFLFERIFGSHTSAAA